MCASYVCISGTHTHKSLCMSYMNYTICVPLLLVHKVNRGVAFLPRICVPLVDIIWAEQSSESLNRTKYITLDKTTVFRCLSLNILMSIWEKSCNITFDE